MHSLQLFVIPIIILQVKIFFFKTISLNDNQFSLFSVYAIDLSVWNLFQIIIRLFRPILYKKITCFVLGNCWTTYGLETRNWNLEVKQNFPRSFGNTAFNWHISEWKRGILKGFIKCYINNNIKAILALIQ